MTGGYSLNTVLASSQQEVVTNLSPLTSCRGIPAETFYPRPPWFWNQMCLHGCYKIENSRTGIFNKASLREFNTSRKIACDNPKMLQNPCTNIRLSMPKPTNFNNFSKTFS